MTDIVKLKRAIEKCERSRENIASVTGLSVEALDAKLCGKAEFTASEIYVLARILVPNGDPKTASDIFFAQRVD